MVSRESDMLIIDDMSQHDQIDFEGSDDDIRGRFEQYITQLFSSIQHDEAAEKIEPGASICD
jgi:hypothetical protein